MNLSEEGTITLEQEPNESEYLLLNHDNNNVNGRNHKQLTKSWYQIPSVYWILPIVFINEITNGLIVAPLVKFYLQVSCQHYYDFKEQPPVINIQYSQDLLPDDMCNIPEVQAITSQLLMILTLCQTITGILVAGYYGSLSDRKGRCLILLIVSVGMMFDPLNVILVGNFDKYFGIKFLVIFTFLNGFFGGNSSLNFVVLAYATDCTPMTKRNIVFGLIRAASFLGNSIGLVSGGWIVKATNSLFSVFYIGFATHSLFFLFILFILPESHIPGRLPIANQKRQLQPPRITAILEKINFLSPLKIFFLKNSDSANDQSGDKIPLKAKKYSLLILAGINCAQEVAISGGSSLFILYITYKFKWTVIEQGYLISITYVLKIIVLLTVLPALHTIFKKNNLEKGKRGVGQSYANNDEECLSSEVVVEEQDEIQMRKELLFNARVINVGLASSAIAYFIYGLAETGFVFIIGACIRPLSMITVPTITSLQTNLVQPSQVGQLSCANSILGTIADIIAPLIFNTLYSILILRDSLNLIWFGIASILIVSSIMTLGIK